MNKQVELLSPAKNLECGVAAINHGADAVYIGAPKFGARKQAGNSLDDLAALIEHAHLYNARVYVAFNTLLFDDELQEAEKLIEQIYRIGADALIIQDMGILEMNLPPIALHASTQTDVRTAQKVAFFEQIGFDQVVLARELSINQIKAIREQTSVKLECFIHGALCVCYSGQCYMSQSINGRSANRGECAQPCRLPYSLKDSHGNSLSSNKHLLSLKDLNLSQSVGQLIDAGVYSLKIEGRLKDVDYVKNITAYYRQIIDAELAKRPGYTRSSIGIATPNFTPNPEKSFSRGFSSYFAYGRGEEIWNQDTPKSLGEKIGKIARIERDHFVLEKDAPKLSNGDGLCFFSKTKDLQGVRVNNVDQQKVYPASMKELYAGATIYRNYDQVFNKLLSTPDSTRKINIKVKFTETANKEFQIVITDEGGISSSITSPLVAEPAKNATTAIENIKTQLSKMGGTPFAIESIDVKVDTPLFIQARELNEFRRKAVATHTEQRLASNRQTEKQWQPTDVPYLSSDLDYRANILNEKARNFYIRHGVKSADWGFEIQKNNLREVMTTKHCILNMMDKCIKKNPEAKQLMPLTLYNDKDKYKVTVDCKNCEMKLTKE